VLALLATFGNYLVTLWRGRKHVRLTSHIAVEEWEDEGKAPEEPHSEEPHSGVTRTYICNVTNTGFIGATIEGVYLILRDPGFLARLKAYIRWRTLRMQWEYVRAHRVARLQLLEDADPRKLDPGESQKWGVTIDGWLKRRILEGPRYPVDTNDEYVVDEVKAKRVNEDDIDYMVSSTGTVKGEQILAVALDTTGKWYRQKTKDAVSYKDFMYYEVNDDD
jgi:hypothetical protein